jgi:cell division septation protein DedD
VGPAKGGQAGHGKKLLRFSLLALALGLLAVGKPWDKDIIDQLNLFPLKRAIKGETIRIPITKGILKPVITEKAEALTSKPKTQATDPPQGNSGPELRSPFAPSPSLALTLSSSAKGAELRPPVAMGAPDIEIPSSQEKPSSYPYSLYLGSFRTLKRAKKAIAIYQKKGLAPYWVKVTLRKKGEWYRVYVGCFRDPKKAKQFRETHGLTDATVKSTPYANLIGIYTSPGEIEDQSQSLRNLGYFPYIIKDHNGRSRLFVGAFLPEGRALRQCRELESSGITSRVVKR